MKPNEKGIRGIMKKQVNKNFILTLTLVAMLLLVIILGVTMVYALNSGMNGLQSDITRMRSGDEIGDVEGYGIIVNSIGYGLGGIGKILIAMFLVIIPSALVFFIFVFALIARLIYKETPGRISAYRILMGFSFAGQIIMFLVSLSLLTSGGWGSLISLVISAYIFWALFMGMRGTYTNRIKSNGNVGIQE